MANENRDPTFDSDRWSRIWDLFHRAHEFDPSRRNVFIQDECGSDPDLRSELEELFQICDENPTLLERPAVFSHDFELDSSEDDSDKLSIQPGVILAGRFEIVRVLGSGGMSKVYEAFDLKLNTHIAIKILKSEIASDSHAIDRFHREINLARRVTHPNVCRIFDLFHQEEGLFFLTMELLDGETLYHRVQHAGPFTPSEAFPIIQQLAAALTAAHEVGVVHRDLKSSNVILLPDEAELRVVVTDFGLAKSLAPDRQTAPVTGTGQLIGTPEFMAPEQLEKKEITPATDVYALGLVIYHMLTGELPFKGDSPFHVANQRLKQPAPSPRRHLPGLDRKWERTILRCLERDPSDRFQTPNQVIQALQGEISTKRYLPKRRRRLRMTIAAVLILVISMVAAALFQRMDSGTDAGPVALGFQERDWVLIADFDNRTGDELLNGTLEYALRRELSNSRFVNVVPSERISDALRLMKKSSESQLDFSLAREVALRDGSVRALIIGKAEKIGSNYLLTAEIVEPDQGTAFATLKEEAEGQDQLMRAIQRLSYQARANLGESLPQIRQSREKLEKVSTPSFRALQLYTKAEAVIGGINDAVAEELLRKAIAEDPDFASAYIFLAFAIRNQGRPEAEYLPFAERALQLAETTTDREEYFIRGAYFSLVGQYEDCIRNYETLLQLYPDHFWGNRNMSFILAARLGRFSDALPYKVRSAEVRPNSWGDNFSAAGFLSYHNHPEEARPFAARALQLVTALELTPQHEKNPYPMVWLRFYPARYYWLQGKIPETLTEVNNLSSSLVSESQHLRREMADHTSGYYVLLGMLSKAEQIFQPGIDPVVYDQILAITAFMRNDQEGLRNTLVRQLKNVEKLNSLDAIHLVRAGMLTEARSLAGILKKQSPSSVFVQVAEGDLALAEGRIDEAISLLQDLDQMNLRVSRGSFYAGNSAIFFLGSESLALALERKGDLQAAYEVLDLASQEKARTSPWAAAYWMRVQWRQAQLYRKLNQTEKAKKIEAELRNLLTYSDPDVYLLKQLGESEVAKRR